MSYLIAAIGITSIWLMRRRFRLANWIGLLNQCIWLVYASMTAQYGFVIGALFAGSGYLNNLTGYIDRIRSRLGLAPSARPTVTEVDAELLKACEELVAAMIQLDKGHHREVLRGQVAIAQAQQCAVDGGDRGRDHGSSTTMRA